MTPREQAQAIYDKHFEASFSMNSLNAFDNTLITVQLIVDQWEYIDTYLGDGNGELNPNLKYWYQVELELEKMIKEYV